MKKLHRMQKRIMRIVSWVGCHLRIPSVIMMDIDFQWMSAERRIDVSDQNLYIGSFRRLLGDWSWGAGIWEIAAEIGKLTFVGTVYTEDMSQRQYEEGCQLSLLSCQELFCSAGVFNSTNWLPGDNFIRESSLSAHGLGGHNEFHLLTVVSSRVLGHEILLLQKGVPWNLPWVPVELTILHVAVVSW